MRVENMIEPPKLGTRFALWGPDGLLDNKLADFCIRFVAVGAISYYSLKFLVNAIDPTRRQKQESKEKAERLLKQLGVDRSIELNEYELAIAAQLVDPSSITTSWDDVAGLDDVIDDIKSTIIFPMRNPDLFALSELHQPPKGVLLHGPPGCGKTMIAKATARDAGARFINLEVPALTDKWYGESQKLAAAVFTLAMKLEPCIIFIDEIDTFLRSRDSHDHEATAMMKAQFMILWDGLISARHSQVIVMGATNRPGDVDKAILRRLPAMFQINRPDQQRRKAILQLVLRKEGMDANVDIDEISKGTEGFSGSDIRELCRSAAMFRIRELSSLKVKSNHFNGHSSGTDPDQMTAMASSLRPLKMDDFLCAIQRMKESKALIGGHYAVIGLD